MLGRCLLSTLAVRDLCRTIDAGHTPAGDHLVSGKPRTSTARLKGVRVPGENTAGEKTESFLRAEQSVQ